MLSPFLILLQMIKFLQKSFLALIALVSSLSASAYTSDEFVWDFEWLEPNNKVEIVVGEAYQLRYTSRTNTDKVFTSTYADCWIHYDFKPFQHIVESPEGYSINEKGEIIGLVAGSYAIKYTGRIQAKSGTDKWLYITIVNEREENESNNTLDTANEFYKKIKVSLYNISDIDYVKYKHNVSNGTYLKFKVHYNGSGSFPFGFKWATFSGVSPQQMGGGSLINQDQTCNCLIYGGEYAYFELYYDQSLSQYFSSYESFTIEVEADDTGVENVGIEDNMVVKNVRKHIINGKLFIEKNGQKFNVDGTHCK